MIDTDFESVSLPEDNKMQNPDESYDEISTNIKTMLLANIAGT